MGGINHDQFFILSASTLLQRQMVMLLYNTPWVVPTTLFFLLYLYKVVIEVLSANGQPKYEGVADN
jgi:hypothetical protein